MEKKQLKRLPVGIQTFEKIRENDMLYIDKTNVAKTYSVRAVPSMFLIDTATMDIIASGDAARGEQLAKKLAELF